MLGKQKQMGWWIAIAVAMGMVCASHVSAQKPIKPPPPPSAKLVNLGPGVPTAMNQLDLFVEIVGHNGAGVGRYWMVDSTGVLVAFDLASFPGATGSTTEAYDINNHGTIVGCHGDPDLGWQSVRPLVWATPESLPVELPVPDDVYNSGASAINDDGLVIGIWYESNGQRSLVAWKLSVSDGIVTVLDRLVIVTAPNVFAVKTTNSGYVSYTAEGSSGVYHAFRLRLTWDEFLQELSEVEGSRSQLFPGYSEAIGVNEAGTVCGRYRSDSGRNEAFAMTIDGELLVLPQLPGGKLRGKTYEVYNRCAVALNNASPVQVVGWATKFFTDSRQWIADYDVRITVNTSITNLEDEVSNWVDSSVRDINDAGWIIGRTTDGAVVLIP